MRSLHFLKPFVVYRVFLLFVIAVILPGCQSGSPIPDDLPSLSSCSITITQDGAPLEGATVTLIAVQDETGQDELKKWGSGGTTDARGRAEIYTNGRYKGAPKGKFKVVISKTEIEPSKLPPAPPQDDPGYAAWLDKAESEQRPSYFVVEKKYGDFKKTPHEIEVVGKTVSETFDVGKPVKEK